MIKTFTIKNSLGDCVDILNLGARLVKWETLVNNKTRDIIVGYSNPQAYQDDTSHLGAIAGPYANRIKNAEVTLNGVLHKLAANEGANLLHSGANALESCIWQVKTHSANAITLTCELEDGFNGFPGAITFDVEYKLTDNNSEQSQLIINMNAVSEKETVVGPTGHAYFNLTGTDKSTLSDEHFKHADNINQHLLLLNSQQYTPVDEQGIPTGVIASVKNTQFDFTQLEKVGQRLINHNFVVYDNNMPYATLVSPKQDLILEVSSDYPGIQVYTSDYLPSPFNQRQGICLEPQFYPDAPNVEHFPFYTTTPQRTFNQKIVYTLKK